MSNHFPSLQAAKTHVLKRMHYPSVMNGLAYIAKRVGMDVYHPDDFSQDDWNTLAELFAEEFVLQPTTDYFRNLLFDEDHWDLMPNSIF